jgi:hypothetical protein
MPHSELDVVTLDSRGAPGLIARAGPETRKKFFEFFTVPIRLRAHPNVHFHFTPSVRFSIRQLPVLPPSSGLTLILTSIPVG